MSPLDRLEWLRTIATTPGMIGAPLAVAVAMTEYINLQTSDARPSVATLANTLRLDPRTVQRSVRALEAVGLLIVEHPTGRKCCTYRPANPGTHARVEPRQPCQGPTPAPTPGLNSANPGTPVRQPWQITSPTLAWAPPEQGGTRIEQGSHEPRSVPSPGDLDFPRGDEAAFVGPIFALKSGVGWRCQRGLLDGFAAAYPDVDIDAELNKSAAWCASNPSKRKTAAGMSRFLNSWMTRAKPSEQAPPLAISEAFADELLAAGLESDHE